MKIYTRSVPHDVYERLIVKPEDWTGEQERIDDAEAEHDFDYVCDSEDDGEPLEYYSDIDLSDEEQLMDLDEGSEPLDNGKWRWNEDGEAEINLSKLRRLAERERTENDCESVADEDLESDSQFGYDPNESDPGVEDKTDDYWRAKYKRKTEQRRIEHLAGPGCQHPHGYCGFNVTAEEMRGCTTNQCLVRKPSEWEPQPDSYDFERKSNYFLSGLSSYMKPRLDNNPWYTPPRHGVEQLSPDVVFWSDVSCTVRKHVSQIKSSAANAV